MVMQDWLSCILVWLTYHKIFSYTKIHEMSIWRMSYTHFNIKKNKDVLKRVHPFLLFITELIQSNQLVFNQGKLVIESTCITVNNQ